MVRKLGVEVVEAFKSVWPWGIVLALSIGGLIGYVAHPFMP
jgi:hypothetical protein